MERLLRRRFRECATTADAVSPFTPCEMGPLVTSAADEHRRQNRSVLQSGVALGRAARSGFAERRARSCHCGRQDRGVTPVGFRSVPVGGPGGGVFAVGGSQWRSCQAGGAEAGIELNRACVVVLSVSQPLA